MGTGAPRPAPAEGAQRSHGQAGLRASPLLSSRRGGPGPARLGGPAGGGGGPWAHVLAARLLTRPAAPPGWPRPERAEPGARPAAAAAAAASLAPRPAGAPARGSSSRASRPRLLPPAPRRSQPQPPEPEDYERAMRRLRRWAFAALLLLLLPRLPPPGECPPPGRPGPGALPTPDPGFAALSAAATFSCSARGDSRSERAGGGREEGGRVHPPVPIWPAPPRPAPCRRPADSAGLCGLGGGGQS